MIIHPDYFHGVPTYPSPLCVRITEVCPVCGYMMREYGYVLYCQRVGCDYFEPCTEQTALKWAETYLSRPQTGEQDSVTGDIF